MTDRRAIAIVEQRLGPRLRGCVLPVFPIANIEQLGDMGLAVRLRTLGRWGGLAAEVYLGYFSPTWAELQARLIGLPPRPRPSFTHQLGNHVPFRQSESFQLTGDGNERSELVAYLDRLVGWAPTFAAQVSFADILAATSGPEDRVSLLLWHGDTRGALRAARTHLATHADQRRIRAWMEEFVEGRVELPSPIRELVAEALATPDHEPIVPSAVAGRPSIPPTFGVDSDGYLRDREGGAAIISDGRGHFSRNLLDFVLWSYGEDVCREHVAAGLSSDQVAAIGRRFAELSATPDPARHDEASYSIDQALALAAIDVVVGETRQLRRLRRRSSKDYAWSTAP